MKRKPAKSKNEFTAAARREIDRRSGGRCEADITMTRVAMVLAANPEMKLTFTPLPECRGRGGHKHHIRRRWHGEGTAANGLNLCDPCHIWIHANIEVSQLMGYLARSGAQR